MKKYLLHYKKENAVLLFLMIFINGIETSFAFLQMYIGKQVIEGEIKKYCLLWLLIQLLHIFSMCFYI